MFLEYSDDGHSHKKIRELAKRRMPLCYFVSVYIPTATSTVNVNDDTQTAIKVTLHPWSTLGTINFDGRKEGKYRVAVNATLGKEKARVLWRSGTTQGLNGPLGRNNEAETEWF